eukprot:3464681-Alexandrium_andersonii.AAC.1
MVGRGDVAEEQHAPLVEGLRPVPCVPAHRGRAPLGDEGLCHLRPGGAIGQIAHPQAPSRLGLPMLPHASRGKGCCKG